MGFHTKMPGMSKKILNLVFAVAVACSLSACAAGNQIRNDASPSLTVEERINRPDTTAEVSATPAIVDDEPIAVLSGGDAVDPEIQADEEISSGTGSFIDTQAAQRNAWSGAAATGDIVLNFENSDIREVVKTILGDMLGSNYMVDPAVAGTVTLSTSQPMSIGEVLPTLEALLRMNGAVLRKTDGIYSVVPSSKAYGGALSPQIGVVGDRGFQLLVVPLRFISATEMQAIIEPMLPESSILNVDSKRNLLLIGGSKTELDQARATVRVFDTDQMKGKSIGLFRLKNAEAESVRSELETVLGADSGGLLAEMIQVVTIDRLNALIVISNQSAYLDEAADWIARFDRADETAGMNMYVYPVQNGRAENLASLLTELFSGSGNTGARSMSRTGSGALSPSPSNASQPGIPTGQQTTSASVGAAGDVCSNLMVKGDRPAAPTFTIATAKGEIIERGKFEYG